MTLEPNTLIKSLTVWLAILVLAVANGILRENVLLPKLGQTPAYIASGLLLSALIILVAYIALPWLGVKELRSLVAVGIGWLMLTLAFEFTFGLWQGKSLATLLEAYTFRNGNLWPVVLLVTVAAPYVAAKLRGWL